MKKLLILATTIFLLAGCSSSPPKKESKTCSMSVSGITMDFKLDGEDDVVHNLGMNLTIPGSLFGGDASILSEDDLKMMGEQTLNQLNVKQGNGISTNFTVKDKDLVAEVAFDLKNLDKETLASLGLKENTSDLKLSEAVKDLEAGGATCK